MVIIPLANLKTVLRLYTFTHLITLTLEVSCANHGFDTLNAIASIEDPGFIYSDFNASSGSNILIISTAIQHLHILGINQSEILQTHWFDTHPETNTNHTHLPYRGCIVTSACPGNAQII
jgi:hypothetical protein